MPLPDFATAQSGLRLLIDPNNDASALLVFERTDNDENEINKRPDAQAAQRDYLKYSGSNLADIKPVHSEYPKEPAQQQGGETALGTGARRPHAGRCTAVRTCRRQI